MWISSSWMTRAPPPPLLRPPPPCASALSDTSQAPDRAATNRPIWRRCFMSAVQSVRVADDLVGEGGAEVDDLGAARAALEDVEGVRPRHAAGEHDLVE